MASIILGAAGSALGSTLGGPVGGQLGGKLGRLAGGFVDDRVFGRDIRLKDREGPRLSDLAVQTSTYGRMLPVVYGTARIAGNIIWSQPIREIVTTSTSSSSAGGGKGGGGGRVTQTSTSYSYTVNIAVAICEGPVDEIMRIWADAKLLALGQYTVRLYTGTEAQLADPLIAAIQGSGNTPAYRGVAYAVFENFPLADFGNRIPNFTFEVRKTALHPDFDDKILENEICGMVMIPGAGEYVYDTQAQYKIPGTDAGGGWVQQGAQVPLNVHNPFGMTNARLSLQQLKNTCKNVGWLNVVVTWFGDSLDAGDCIVKPGVEYQVGAITSPDTWTVGGFTRTTARQITLEGTTPRYGGTPDDNSIIRFVDVARAMGYQVLFSPLMFMDIAGKPWRGYVSGSASDTADFFTKTNGYNAFIMHYANLLAGRVDAFAIGSELKGLTAVTDTPGSYPAVNALIDLASSVKSVLGASVKVTYAADWSEYHHADGGWYHMDPLWACDDIDMIGIDAYFPLSNTPQGEYDIQALIDGWESGEGYDFYFSDPERTVQAPLSAPYAWKNIRWFWENVHTNPDANATPWVPESKPVWFTEYGFPSVDGAANQPNVFYDPSTSGSAFPYFSRGRVDFRAQRTGLMATEAKWAGSDMVERMFIWTWDARPYPYWPDLQSVWADGQAWKTGHWVQGKLGLSSLAAILTDLAKRAGLSESDIDVSQTSDRVEGYVLTSPISLRTAIEQLQSAFRFDSIDAGNVLRFTPRGAASVADIAENDLALTGQVPLAVIRQQEVELPKRVNVLYLNRLTNYQPATQYSQRETTLSRQVTVLELPLVMSDQYAKLVADTTLYMAWAGRVSYRFALPPSYSWLEPGDVITVQAGGITHRMRLTQCSLTNPGLLDIQGIADDPAAYDFYSIAAEQDSTTQASGDAPETALALLDIAALPGDSPTAGALRTAACGMAEDWRGAVLFRSDDGGVDYARTQDMTAPAGVGAAITALADGPCATFDEANDVIVALTGDAVELSGVSELAVLNGANAAVLGDEIIQFQYAEALDIGKYRLYRLLRGRLGTEHATGAHTEGERFVLLNSAVQRLAMPNTLLGLARHYKGVSVGRRIEDTPAMVATYTGQGFKPYAPVHVQATRDGSNNITLNWTRRTRAGGEWQDYVDIPLNETDERYEVDIMDGATVVRTLSGLTGPTASYSAANQTTDFGGVQNPLTVRIYQLSSVVGRGWPAEFSG